MNGPWPGDCIAVDERCTVANARLLGMPKWSCSFCFNFRVVLGTDGLFSWFCGLLGADGVVAVSRSSSGSEVSEVGGWPRMGLRNQRPALGDE